MGKEDRKFVKIEDDVVVSAVTTSAGEETFLNSEITGKSETIINLAGDREMADNKERREFEGDVWVEVCMDEDIDYGENVIAYGVVASGITRMGTGNQELLPDAKREMLAKVSGVVTRRLAKLAEKEGGSFVVTSHAGCGGGAAQAITTAEDLEKTTVALCEELGVEYLGHVPHANEPVEVGNSNVNIHIGRSEAEHHHGARRVIFTVGGGIKERELQILEADNYGDGFIVSADVLAQAVADGDVTEDEAIDYLMLHLDIADGIADGVTKDSAAYVFNAGRLEGEDMLANYALVKKMLARVNQG